MPSQPLTRSEVQDRLAEAQTEIFRLGVQRVALFGSVQRNEARSDSDVDVLVEFASGLKTFDHLLDLGELLENSLGRRVDLVTVESL